MARTKLSTKKHISPRTKNKVFLLGDPRVAAEAHSFHKGVVVGTKGSGAKKVYMVSIPNHARHYHAPAARVFSLDTLARLARGRRKVRAHLAIEMSHI